MTKLVIRGSILEAARTAAAIAAKGLPALRAGLHGARIGAGAAFGPAVVKRLGVEVVESAAEVTAPVAATAIAAAGRGLVRAGHDGVALRIGGGGGVRAMVTEGAVRTFALGTTRTALLGVARAARSGAVAGAVVEGVFGAVEAARAFQEERLDAKGAAMLAGKRAARGAAAGAAGVATAAVASAAIAATGIGVLGAPVVVPIVTMVAAGAAVSRGFDKLFGE